MKNEEAKTMIMSVHQDLKSQRAAQNHLSGGETVGVLGSAKESDN